MPGTLTYITPRLVTDTAALTPDVIDVAVKSDGTICVIFVEDSSYDLKSAISSDGKNWTISTVSTEYVYYNNSKRDVRTASVAVIGGEFAVALPANWYSAGTVAGIRYVTYSGSAWNTPETVYSYNPANDVDLLVAKLVEIDGKPTIKYNGIDESSGIDNRYGVYQKDGTWQDLGYGTYTTALNYNYLGDATAPITGLGTDIHVANYYNSSPTKLQSYYYNGTTWSSALDVIYGVYPSMNSHASGLGLAYYTGSSLGYAASTDGTSWSTEVVDADGDVGLYPNLFYDGTNPVIVYFDQDNDDLKIAIKDGTWQIYSFVVGVSVSKNVAATINGNVIHVTWITDDGSGEVYHFSFSVLRLSVESEPFSIDLIGTHRVINQFDTLLRGTSHVINRFDDNAMRGVSSVKMPTGQDLRGWHGITMPFVQDARGTHRAANLFIGNSIRGTSHVINRFDDNAMRGTSSAKIRIIQDTRGVASVLGAYLGSARGVSSVKGLFDGNSMRGLSSFKQPFLTDLRGASRVANDASNRYEVFVGTDEDPDFSGDPVETFSSLPHVMALQAPDVGQVTYHIVVRKRDRWNLECLNNVVQYVTINAAGELLATPPRGPQTVTLTEVSDYKVHIEAEYNYPADGDNAADKWLLYMTTDGSDPDPTTDTPLEIAMVKTEAITTLNYTTGVLELDDIVNVLIRTRRSDDSVDSTNTSIRSLVIAGTDMGPVTHTDSIMGAVAPIQPE